MNTDTHSYLLRKKAQADEYYRHHCLPGLSIIPDSASAYQMTFIFPSLFPILILFQIVVRHNQEYFINQLNNEC